MEPRLDLQNCPLMPHVVSQIQTINRLQRTHYRAQGQMVFDEISLNAIVELRRICRKHEMMTRKHHHEALTVGKAISEP